MNFYLEPKSKSNFISFTSVVNMSLVRLRNQINLHVLHQTQIILKLNKTFRNHVDGYLSEASAGKLNFLSIALISKLCKLQMFGFSPS